ncbi:MAG: ABC transporter permease [Acidobacteriota bacterium]
MTWASLPARLRHGLTVLGVLTTVCVVGPWMAGDPTAIVEPAQASLLPPGSTRWVVELRDGSRTAARDVQRQEGGWLLTGRGEPRLFAAGEVVALRRTTFWLGTDTLGRDVLARLLWGGRVSLLVGLTALAVAMLLGTSAGLLAGWRGGLVDGVLMRLADALLAFPALFLLLLVAAIFRPSLSALVLMLGGLSWMGVARLVRGQLLSLKEREFILAARGIGASPLRIALVHLLPNTLTPLSQDAALRLGDLILAEASLSFLGFGVAPPLPSWGGMVAEAGEVLGTAWWLILLPGLAVATVVIGAALLADGLAELARPESA